MHTQRARSGTLFDGRDRDHGAGLWQVHQYVNTVTVGAACVGGVAA